MKTRIKNFFPSLPIFLTSLTFFAASVASAQIPSSGLVGYWPFNGNANDESGNGNNGTVNGATLTTDRFGNANSAYSFDGVNDYIQYSSGSATSLNVLGDFSISFWLKTSSTGSSSRTIISFGNQLNNNSGGVTIGINDGITQAPYGRLGYATQGQWRQSTNTINDNTWHFVVITLEGSVFTLYIDNVLNNQSTNQLPTLSWNGSRRIGAGNYAMIGFYKDLLDDISMYNRALTPAEITQLYTDQTSLVEVPCTPFLGEDQTVCAGTSVTLSASGSSLACPTLPATLQNGLVGYWPFCGNANDASGNGNNGTVNGATLTTDRFGNASSAYSFDGVDDFIQCPSTISNLATATISGWAFCNSLFGGQFVHVGEDNNTNCNGIGIGKGGFNPLPGIGGGLNFWNLFQGNKLISLVSCVNYYDSGHTLTNGVWFHYAMVKQNNLFLYYINGALVGTSTILPAINPTNKIFIGCSGSGGPPTVKTFFSGQLDEVSIHNRALSAIEIQQLYTLGQSTYLWSTGATTATINVTPTTTTTYTCTVTDANGNACTDSVTVFVPQIEATDLTICTGESTTLSVSGINSTATPSACPTLPSNLQTGLVGYWPFCGNANDVSGNGNNGTVNGATLTTDRFGNANSAYSFDGVNDIINASANNLPIGISSRTISFWYLQNSANQSNAQKWMIRYGGGVPCSDWGPTIWPNSNFPALDINLNFVVYSNSLQLASWHHYVVTFESLNGLNILAPKVYINGVLQSTQFLVNNNCTINTLNSTPLFIGGSGSGNTNQFFNGKLDDIGIYNRALTPAEIQQLYTLGQTTYSWSTGATTPTINVSPSTTTTYTCTVTTNGVSCTDDITVVVSQPVASITPNGLVEICEGQSIALTANGGVSYLWNTGAPTQSITVNTEAFYTVTVTDENGCTDTESQLVKVNFLPNIGVNNASICSGQSATLTATGGLSYEWSPATGLSSTTGTTVTASPSTSTVYTVTGTGANGCTNTATATVTLNAPPVASITPNGIVEICQGQSIALTANGGTSYLWNTGAPTQSITVNTEAFYTVTVTDENGCTDTESQLVKVNLLPNIGVNNASICSGQSATLTATGGLSYVWSPATGLSATTGSTVTSSTTTNTVYTVTGTSINGCTNTATAAVTVNALPTSTITPASATTFCQGGSVVLTANTGTGLSYQWFNNAVAISGATTSSYTANASGSYTVVVTNTSTCSATSSATVVTVNALPTATITPATATTFCQGGSVVLNANTGTGLTYQWFNNATAISGTTSASYTATTSGSYTVVVTNTSTCSATSTATVVTVNALPSATISPATATTFCQGGSVVLNANTGAGLSYQWRLNGTNISGATTSTYTANASGSYTVVVTNASACSATSAATVVTVNALPTATITPATATTFCQGGSVVLNANSGAGLSYQWYNNAVAISGATTSSYTANASGSYTVVVTNTSTCSAASTATVVTVNALPTATITASSATTFCQGGSVVLNANTGAGLTYQWRLNGTNITGATSSSYTANMSGSYTVVVTNTSTCSATSTATVVTVNALPTATITPATTTTFCQGGSVVLNANSGAGLSYQWFNNAVAISGATASSYTANASGSYTVVVTNTSTCAATSTATVVTVIPNVNYYADADGDGFGDAATLVSTCVQPQGYVTDNTDCDDTSADVNPAANEVCNHIDDDCSGAIDDGLVFDTYYADVDGDTFGDANNSIYECSQPSGYVTNNTDCNDNNANQNTASTEICNGEDDDCDGAIDNGLIFLDYYADLDSDGFGAGAATNSCVDLGAGYVTNNTDCNDNNVNQSAASTEICNGEDDDCDGTIDNGITFFDYYADTDGDGFGAGDVISSCSDLGIGYSTNNTDCDDSNSNINSSATETCNTIDDNCDGQIDEGVQTVYFIDNDGDTYGNPSVSILACTQPIGYTPDDTDCNDTDANINPGAEDIGGNGIDENCDGEIDNSIFELNATISLYPNPTRSELNIQVNSTIIGNDLYIFDAVGKIVYKQQLLSTQTTIPVSNFADGNYVVRVGEVVKRFEVMK